MTIDTLSIQSWLTQAAERIDSDSPQLDAELLLADRLGKSRSYFIAFGDDRLSSVVLAQLENDIEKLENAYPLAYVLGKKAFWDMELWVTEATLIPRADTETLIEVAQTLLPSDTNARWVDLGTGSGAIAIALSRIFPNASITATDISKDALAVAKQNASVWQIAPIEFLQNSWLTGFGAGHFDVIVSNPPYIAENDTHLQALTYEPITALTAARKGMADIETIIEQAQTVLKSGGWLLLEHGYDQGQAVRELLVSAVWANVQTHKDLGGNGRITQGQLRETVA